MRTAKAKHTRFGLVELTCPYCNLLLEAPNGSFFWEAEEVAREKAARCLVCEQTSKIPPSTRVAGMRDSARIAEQDGKNR